jgi:hypothetical protein
MSSNFFSVKLSVQGVTYKTEQYIHRNITASMRVQSKLHKQAGIQQWAITPVRRHGRLGAYHPNGLIEGSEGGCAEKGVL